MTTNCILNKLMPMNKMERYLDSGAGKKLLAGLYRADDATRQKKRYMDVYREFKEHFALDSHAPSPVFLINVPGRVEIGGNHTDHNNGMVVAGSVSLDAVAVCAPVPNGIITIRDTAYNETIKVDTGDLNALPEEEGTAGALVKGAAAGLRNRGYKVGGFNAVLHNEVMSGSGLSSSAVFEVVCGTILNALYNNGEIPFGVIAEVAQHAENVFFGKPCGLMDQMACAAGGIVFIDFKDDRSPFVKSVPMDFDKSGYSVIVVKSGGNHAALTDQYAAIPKEMKSVASFFGKGVLRELSVDELLAKASAVRDKCGDRAFLRSLHYFAENRRVLSELKALESGDMNSFLKLVSQSGDSSWRLLQNVVPSGDEKFQDMGVVLAVTELFIHEKGRGACRVHGGGFAGTILAFIHGDDAAAYVTMIEKITGKGSAVTLKMRSSGALSVLI